MDPRNAATGFLGTGASLAADVALLAYIFLIVPGMLVGFIFARRQKFAPHHKMTMSLVTLFNWILIIYLMAVSYSKTVAPSIPQALNQPFFLSPSIHLLFGLTAQILGTVLVLRMWLENSLPKRLRFEPIKPWMRLTLGLWLITAALGFLTYYLWYGLPFSGGKADETTPGSATQAANVNVSGSAPTVTVPLKQFLFVPVDITVPVGTTIKFINQDSAPHTVTYTDDSFDTGNFFKGDFRELKFEKAGDISLYCILHGAPDGTGMAMIVHVKPASELASVPTTDPNALSPVAPTTAPSVNPPPQDPLKAQVKNQLVGVLSFADQQSFNDTVNLQLVNLEKPPSGKVYYGWLVGGTRQFLSIGKIEPDENGAATIRQSFTRRNLISEFDNFVITTENPNGTPTQPGEVLYSGKEPPDSFAKIREIVGKATDTPNLYGYAVGARLQTDELVRQAALIQELMKVGNIEESWAHAEAIINLIKGGAGENLDGDKTTVQPGDGYGLRKYVENAIKSAQAAKDAKDATGAIKLHVDHVVISGQSALAVMDDLEKQATALIASQKSDRAFNAAKEPAAALQTLALTLRDGADKDNSGTIDPTPGEGTIFSLYDHAQYIAAMAVVSGSGAQISGSAASDSTPAAVATEAATPSGVATEAATEEATPAVESGAVTIKMLDFEFDKTAVTVKVGSDVIWVGAGAGPRHSAKADDGSFDTGLYGPNVSKSLKFDKAGTFPYYCELHGGPGGEGMAGVITVIP
jgi:plastocyanin/uncharacterized membrane protein YozB (DUF420 family)